MLNFCPRMVAVYPLCFAWVVRCSPSNPKILLHQRIRLRLFFYKLSCSMSFNFLSNKLWLRRVKEQVQSNFYCRLIFRFFVSKSSSRIRPKGRLFCRVERQDAYLSRCCHSHKTRSRSTLEPLGTPDAGGHLLQTSIFSRGTEDGERTVGISINPPPPTHVAQCFSFRHYGVTSTV